MTFEENILAYLDGSLGADESAELLHTLSASPDKRELLDAHLRLKNITALGQRPFAVPEYAERALSERLPAIGSGVQKPALAHLPFFSSARVLSFAAGIGALAVAGALLWNSGRPVESSGSLTAPAAQVAPSSNGFSSAPLASANAIPSVQNIQGSEASGNGVLASKSNAVLPSKEGAKFDSRSNHHAALLPGSNGLASAGASVANEDMNIAGHELPSSTTPTVTNDVVQGSDPSITTVNPTEAAIPIPGSRTAHTISELVNPIQEKSSPFGIAARFSTMQYGVPQVAATGSSSSLTAGDISVALSYDLSQYIAISVEDGFSHYATVSNNVTPDPNFNSAMQGYTRMSYTTSVSTPSTNWARLGIEFIVNPASDLPVSIGASGGVAFESTLQPIGAISAGISRFLGGSTWLDLALVATGTYGSAAPSVTALSSPGVTGIVHLDAAPQQTFTPAFGIRFGLRYQ